MHNPRPAVFIARGIVSQVKLVYDVFVQWKDTRRTLRLIPWRLTNMGSPADRKYAESHEWHKPQGDLVAVGISRFAVDELTDVTFVEILKKSGTIKQGQSFGEVESVKATSEIYSSIDGEIVEVNNAVVDNPGLLNEDPWDQGWLVKIKPANPAQLDSLMDAAAYDAKHG